jgi:hypothetical protein
MEIQTWTIDKFVVYARNARKNDAAVDRMCGSIREFGFKIPCLVRSNGELIDGHLRLTAGQGLPPPGESVGYLGRLGRGTAGDRTVRPPDV